MFIDTHCHLDAAVFQDQVDAVIQRAEAVGVTQIVLPAVSLDHLEAIKKIARAHSGVYYAVGIHPMYVSGLSLQPSIDALERFLLSHLEDPQLVGIGEIGLDGFVSSPTLEQQIPFFTAQLQLAKHFDLPVILHNRKAVDLCCKYLKQYHIKQGIFHAFNGSFQQAEVVVNLGFCLGFGGTLTYERSKQIRRLAATLPEECIVLETDAPDIPPAFLSSGQPNEPQYLRQTAEVLAELRGVDLVRIALTTRMASRKALPALLRQVAVFK
jgi:TatD DNase family protein